MTEIYYHGWRDKSGKANVRRVNGNGKRQAPLRPRRDLDCHSWGFEWGYAGSGPAQLALAILADALGDDKLALRLHQRFKFRVISALPQSQEWRLSLSDVLTHVEAITREIESAP